MTKWNSKYGTDSRYPYWSGGTIDQRFLNGVSMLGLIVNYSAIVIVHYGNPSGSKTIVYLIVALAAAVFIMLFIKHKDAKIRNFTRIFVCGIPLLLNLYITYLRFFTYA